MDLAERIRTVRGELAAAERCAGRPPGSVRLLAVSKTKPAAMVRAAHAGGLRDFGENYVQESVAKVQALADLDLVWHFIGAIQSNKTRDIARHFHWVHTVDRLRIARRLDAAAAGPLNICIQVNVDGEPQKAGLAPTALPGFIADIAALPRLRLRGLMAIPKPADTRPSFRRLRELFVDLADIAGPHWDTLSMGMSADFRAAIEEDASIVRIGTAIFGPRT
jgi:hypothetical protein